MKNYIIGIAGRRNAGKDTVASMINYIFNVGVSKATYNEYVVKKNYYDINNDRIIHFADIIKDILSNIYSIPRKYFDDRKYKDELWYCINSNTFIPENSRYTDKDIFIVEIDTLKSFSLNTIINTNKNKNVCIKLRTLMQYFGTNICRNNLDNDICIKATMNKAVDIAETRKICIIPDVRFANEAKAIQCNSSSLYGGVIKINIDNCDIIEHESEIIDIDYNFEINNNGSLLQLFYKVLEICQTLV